MAAGAGAVGTSGATAAVALDPAVRAKLVEFRGHLKEFERAAGGTTAGAMAPSLATDATANPANPASAVMAGMKVVTVRCLDDGDIDLADLRAKARRRSSIWTPPSTRPRAKWPRQCPTHG